ncbi:MAG: hypothetical protein QGG63_00195 [Candidatus Pacebacteria bacterium]|jgi:hypothetical protein|nr:hypothetical protein [Candidatus Paceibacterota bacterium]|tara:strand:+ start:49174 stop:49407 length:234 start_codon:yes stop_codon:yes gene_type:complete
MDLLFWGMTLSITGEVLIGLAVLNVHRHIVKEHKIDEDVFCAIKREKRIALTGIVLMIAGYVMQMYANGYISQFIGS